MGIASSRVKADRAWDEIRNASEEQGIRNASEEQHRHQQAPSSNEWSCMSCRLFGICWPQRPKGSESSSGMTTTDTGTLFLGKKSSTAPPEQIISSGTAIESDGMEPSATLRSNEVVVLASQLRRFSYIDLKLATRNFRPDSVLGEGGFGCVYKGWIDEHGKAPVKTGTGLTVAVKTLNHNGLQGHKEWLAEVTYLGQLHHPNLVKLVGYCIEDDKRLLVYEFMQRGSLENHLFRKGASPLPWGTRIKIALGAAKGVEFLHSREKPVIYRDFKTSNILLDSDYTAKLSDFGLAKDGPEGDKSHVSTRVMGTYGYAAPEYVMTGHLSSKSDIYSFGVVLLELLTGKQSMDKTRPNGEQDLAAWARPYLHGRARILEIIDPRLGNNYSVKGALKAGQLACRCLSRDPKVRPSMGTIVEILEELQDLKDMTSGTDSSQEKDWQSSGFQKMGKRGTARSSR